jgi:AraC-like DNA-binding protein
MHESPNVKVAILGGGAYSAPKGRDYPPHSHTVWELVYYRTGNIRCPVGDETFTGVPGLLLITPPGVVHCERGDTAYSNYFVSASVQGDPDWPTALFDGPTVGFQTLFSGIVQEIRSQDRHRDAMLACYASQLLIAIARAKTDARATSAERLVCAAERLIDERHGESVRIADIADELGCSTSSLRAHFGTLRQTTPLSHLHAVRLRHALNLLRNSSLTVSAVAEKTGYDSASHLTRHVKAATGKSPGGIRQHS